MRITIFTAILFFAISGLNAQVFNTSKMDSLFMLIDENQKGMGSISIYFDGREIYNRSIGFSDMGEQQKATNETVYRIGSISKTYTATIILQLVDEKKIKLTSKVSEFFPEIPNADKITIEQLLRHSSGLFNFTNNPEYLTWMEEAKGQQELLDIIIAGGTVFDPGKKYEYSNSNYVLLTLIAERVENKKFSQILNEKITNPLRLRYTRYGDKINPSNNEALSYSSIAARQVATETHMSIPMGAGAIVSTPSEINQFYIALFSGKLLPEKLLSEMKTIKDGFGMGLFSFPFNDKTAFGHTGGIDGFQSTAAYFEKDKLAVCYLANAVEMPVNDIMIGALSIYLNSDYQLPTFKPAIVVPIEVLSIYTGTYISDKLPLKLKIFLENDALFGQGTGQAPFPLEAFGQNQFRFEPAGIKIIFNPADLKLLLNQGGSEFEMTKEE